MLIVGEFVVGLFLVIVTIIVVALSFRKWLDRKKAAQTWGLFAQTFGLMYAGSLGTGMSGTFGSAQVRVFLDRRIKHVGGGRSGSGTPVVEFFTVFTGFVSGATPAGFGLARQRLSSNIGLRLLGGQDLQMGDPEIDDAFVIRGSDLPKIRELLADPEVRSALLTVVNRRPGLQVEGGTVRWEVQGTVHDVRRLSANLSDLGTVTTALQKACNRIMPQQPAIPPGTRRPVRTAPPRPVPVFAEPGQAQESPPVPAAPPNPQPPLVTPQPQELQAAKPAQAPVPVPETPAESATESPAATAADDGPAGLVAQLAASGNDSRKRDALISSNADRVWNFDIAVDSTSRTFGFSLPDTYRDGRTVEGQTEGVAVQVMMPRSRDQQAAALRRGDKLTVKARVAEWDSLFKRLTLHAED